LNHPAELNDAQALERQPVGGSVTLRVLGACMYPLFRSGDSVTVRRCEECEVARGDIAVVKDRHGRFMAHLVVATRPVRTATFLGREDHGELVLLGRVTAIRRSPAVFPLPTIARPLVWLFHWLAMRLRQGSTSRSAVRYLRELKASKLTLVLRRKLMAPFDVRLLNFRDLNALLAFAGQYLAVPSEFLKQQLLRRWPSTGVAAGAFSRGDRMCGFAYLDRYTQEGLELDGFWVRSLFVAPVARRMGVGRRIVQCLCGHAAKQGITRVWADIDSRNEGSVSLFRQEGFELSSPQLVAKVQQEWWKKGSSISWTVLERSIGDERPQN
jgi:GNAT superfamily N-acetyltransferase